MKLYLLKENLKATYKLLCFSQYKERKKLKTQQRITAFYLMIIKILLKK